MHPVAATGSRAISWVPSRLREPKTLPIGELSKRSGVNIETIRYYERVKMLAPPPRTDSGRRVYHSTGTLPPLGAVEAARVTVATLGQNAF